MKHLPLLVIYRLTVITRLARLHLYLSLWLCPSRSWDSRVRVRSRQRLAQVENTEAFRGRNDRPWGLGGELVIVQDAERIWVWQLCGYG